MIIVTPTISIPESEIEFDFVRSSGAGGQNVNKVSTAVQLRFDVAHSPSLPDEVRTRLLRLAGSRVTADGMLILKAQSFRTQERNRRDAVERLIELIGLATHKPKARRKTKPSLASRRRRVETKRRQGQVKASRRAVSHGDN